VGGGGAAVEGMTGSGMPTPPSGGKREPQNRQPRAAALIVSAQNGDSFVSRALTGEPLPLPARTRSSAPATWPGPPPTSLQTPSRPRRRARLPRNGRAQRDLQGAGAQLSLHAAPPPLQRGGPHAPRCLAPWLVSRIHPGSPRS